MSVSDALKNLAGTHWVNDATDAQMDAWRSAVTENIECEAGKPIHRRLDLPEPTVTGELLTQLLRLVENIATQLLDVGTSLNHVVDAYRAAGTDLLPIHGHEETPSPRVGPVLDTPVVPTTTVGGPSDIDPSSDVGESAGAAPQSAPALAEGGEQS